MNIFPKNVDRKILICIYFSTFSCILSGGLMICLDVSKLFYIGILFLLLGVSFYCFSVIVIHCICHCLGAEARKHKEEYCYMFHQLDIDRDGYISSKEFASVWLQGISSEPGGKTSLQHFPFRLLDKDNRGKISQEEFEAGYELVQAFLAYEAGDGSALCKLLRAKYLEEKKKQKANHVFGHVVYSTTSPGNPAPAALSQSSVTSKCDPQTLKFGSSAVAAEGLRRAVGLDNDKVFAHFMTNPELMIECEILIAGLGGLAGGRLDDIDNYYSVKFGESGDWDEEKIIIDDEDGKCKAPVPDHVKISAKSGKYHGGDFNTEDYDYGNKGKKLQDFCNDAASVLANLLIYEVLVLRLYTSSTFKLFNGPMRSLLEPDVQKLRHPLRFTIYVLTEGIKKLRAVEAKREPEGFNETKTLWRGMANRKLDEMFKLGGGTEMAVMSTTSEKKVALSYASGENALVFKYTTRGLTRGVEIQFLSLYPKEVEYVYPPLTYLSVIDDPYIHDNVKYVEVMPVMS